MTVKDDMIYGPGAEDCKSGALLIYYLCAALLEKKLPVKFRAILNTDEEVGSPHSRDYIEEISKHCRYCFVFEPGRDNGDFVVKRRGEATYTLVFHGVKAHSGRLPTKAPMRSLKWPAGSRNC